MNSDEAYPVCFCVLCVYFLFDLCPPDPNDDYHFK